MKFEANIEAWQTALMLRSRTTHDGQQAALVSRVLDLINCDFERCNKADLRYIDDVYPYLPEQEQDRVKEFVVANFDYTELGSKTENDFPMQLKIIRAEKGLTQKEAAALCDVPISTWESWERETRKPTTYTMRSVIATLAAVADS